MMSDDAFLGFWIGIYIVLGLLFVAL